uniref:AAA_12 domain-containing protein n=1 Tax=Caenorhabditis japonica TaxID=281687 RepID=A0A8R1DG79_CAEJA
MDWEANDDPQPPPLNIDTAPEPMFTSTELLASPGMEEMDITAEEELELLAAEPIIDILPGYNPDKRTSTGPAEEQNHSSESIACQEETMFLQAEPTIDILPGYNPAKRTSTGLVDETTSAADIIMEEETVVDQTESTRDILPGYNPAIRMSSDPVEVQSPAADLTTLNKTIKNLTEPSKERPLPSNVRVLDTHPFQSWYRVDVERNQRSSHAENIADSITLGQIHGFRNSTAEAARTYTKPSGLFRAEAIGRIGAFLEGVQEVPNVAGAIYILESLDGTEWRAAPAHVETVAEDRPDLHQVSLDNYATDCANPTERPHPSNYFPGDAIFVTELEPRPNAEYIHSTFEKIREAGNHRFWKVKTFHLIAREIHTNVLVSRLAKNRSGYAKSTFVAAGLDVLTRATKSNFRDTATPGSVENKRMATIFIPKLSPGQLLESITPGATKVEIVQKTAIHAMGTPCLPHIVKLYPLDRRTMYDLFSPTPLFQKFRQAEREAFGPMVITAYLGYSGVLAMANKNKDLRLHTSSVKSVTISESKPVITMEVSNPSGPLSLAQWTRSSPFRIDVKGERQLDMEVESATANGANLVISAKPTSNQKEVSQFIKSLRGAQIILYQKMEKNVRLLKEFPDVDTYYATPDDAPFKILLEAAYGGRSVKQMTIPNREIRRCINNITPSPEQAHYINAVARSANPVIVAAASFGVGKTLMIALAIYVAALEGPEDEQHMATATNNAAVAALVLAYMKIDEPVSAVRIITKHNYELIDPKLRTPLDFPVLWIEKLRQHVFRTDNNISRRGTVDNLTADAIFYLKQESQLNAAELHSQPLLSCFRNNNKRTSSLFNVFLKIARPRIFFGTTASITESIHRGLLAANNRRIATIQIDEASQYPIHALISLGPLCPSARITLIGDVQQLEPYADTDLPTDLKGFAVGELLRAVSGKVPLINLLQVRRCPYEITALCSGLFYPIPLQSTRSRGERNVFSESLHINNSPLHIIDTSNFGEQQTSGTSLYNVREADLASKLVHRLLQNHHHASIAVLTFYKAQCGLLSQKIGDTDAFVGTIDSSQGSEYDVTIILTSRTTPFHSARTSKAKEIEKQKGEKKMEDFIEDSKRINVALSRTRHLCLVMADTQMAESSEVWRKLLNRVSRQDNHKAGIFSDFLGKQIRK